MDAAQKVDPGYSGTLTGLSPDLYSTYALLMGFNPIK